MNKHSGAALPELCANAPDVGPAFIWVLYHHGKITSQDKIIAVKSPGIFTWTISLYVVILNEDYISSSFTLSLGKGVVDSNACLVYIYSPGGVYPYYLYNELDAFWVNPYPVNSSQ